jgi:TolA-binding protein
MQSYRRYLDETPTSTMTPEAMRRLADLKLEREFGIIGDGTRWIEMAAPETVTPVAIRAALPAAPRAQTAQGETDEEFELRASAELPFAPAGTVMLDALPGAELGNSGPLEAIAIYQRLLEEYPSYERRTQVLYQMARAYDELGRTEEALAVMERLIGEFGFSKYADEVQFRRGEYFFTRRMFNEAERAYQAITDMGEASDFYELALYKLGWTLYKQDFYDEALHRYMALLDYKLSIGYDFDADHEEEDERRVADTFRVISLSFSNLGGPEVISEYYAANGSRPYEDRIYENLAEFYFDKLRYNDAAAVYDSFIERYAFHRAAPDFSMRVIEIYGAGGFPKLVVESKKDFATRYGLTSEYWRHFDVAERPEVEVYLKTNLTDLANHYHALYQDEALVEDKPANYSEAQVWYRAFLESFPAAEESPGINYQLADLMLENDDFGDAAREYERTAYEYAAHERAAAAGYAAIFAHRENLKVTAPERETDVKRATVDSSLKFADTFPDHEEAAVVLGAAAEDLYAMDDFAPAAAAGRTLSERYPAADVALERSAWTVVAHSSFELEDFPAAEPAYAQALALTPDEDEGGQALVDIFAAAIYKQVEQASAAVYHVLAACHYLRI